MSRKHLLQQRLVNRLQQPRTKLTMQLNRRIEYISCYLILCHYTLLCASASLRELNNFPVHWQLELVLATLSHLDRRSLGECGWQHSSRQRIVRRVALSFPAKDAFGDKGVVFARGGVLRDFAYARFAFHVPYIS